MIDIFKIKKLKHLSFAEKSGLSIYPWKNCKPENSASLKKELSKSNVAIISSGGFYVKYDQNHLITK